MSARAYYRQTLTERFAPGRSPSPIIVYEKRNNVAAAVLVSFRHSSPAC
jgi:hypothetical protein